MDRRTFLAAGGAALTGALARPAGAQTTASTLVEIAVDMRSSAGRLDHIWSECVGSDRAAMTLRASWRRDLDRWRSEAGLKRVRFHGIFNDELGVFAPSILNRNRPAPNWQNVDRVYDGLIEHGVEPLVELSFMPRALASGDATFGFYRGNITPPRALDDWTAFIRQFALHLLERYGASTVRRWPFEVWNEPNLPFFWTGNQQQYFDLYRATALALKAVDPAIKVGGPSTAHAGWIREFASFCQQTNTPIDFFSTHSYAGDNQRTVFGEGVSLPQADVIPEAMRRCRSAIDSSSFRGRPLWLTEWSSDSPAMIAHVITQCLPSCQSMSQWALSGDFEELGVADYLIKEGDMGWGMIIDGIPRPSFNTYRLLNALGGARLPATGPALAARSRRGAAALVWNLAEVTQPSGIPGLASTRTVRGEPKRFRIAFPGARPGQPVRIRYVDQARGSPLPAWRAMGSPRYPTARQRAILRQGAEIPPAAVARLGADASIAFDLPPEGVALVELAGA